MQNENESNLMTVREAADFLRLSVPTLNRMRVEKRGPPYVKLTTRVFYDRNALQAYVAQSVVAPTQGE